MKIFRSWIWPILGVILVIIAFSMKCNDEPDPQERFGQSKESIKRLSR